MPRRSRSKYSELSDICFDIYSHWMAMEEPDQDVAIRLIPILRKLDPDRFHSVMIESANRLKEKYKEK